MRRAYLAPAFLMTGLLTGCSAGLVGDPWAGTCVLGEASDAWVMPIEITFVRDIQGELLGEGVYTWEERDFKGVVEGKIAGEDMSMELPGVYGGYTVTLLIEAEIDGEDEITGICEFDGVQGEFELTRGEGDEEDGDEGEDD
jgi:hypothetical protein